MARRWIYRPPDPTSSRLLADRLALSPVAAQVLLNRGMADADAAARFLAPELRHLADPFLFRDMRRAAERVKAATLRREKILIYGDYDVDGMTGTSILFRTLTLAGADVAAFIPDRLADGYGLKPARMQKAAADGFSVVIAVDNGTTAFEAVDEARRRGLDLIVVDHHEPALDGDGPGVRLPEVFALLNPKVPGETYPFHDLCGCGVAFKLAWGVAQLLAPGARASPAMRELLLDSLSLVAIGTIADSVPLAGENRVLAAFGLRALAATKHPGLFALMKLGRVEGPPGPEDVGFRIAPRLNAAGRMGLPGLGLDLLLATDDASALSIARSLDDANKRRQTIERKILEDALARADAALAAAGGRAIVLADEAWHLGVIGIVASRLVERYNRPAVMIALDGERGRGSARSVPGIALHEAFARCKEHLLGFGGHAAAAGLEIRADKVDRFRARFAEALAEAAPDVAPGGSAPLEIDAGLEIRHCSRALVEELRKLEPHGRGNEAPLFAARDVTLAAPPRLVGRNADHLSLLVRQGETVLKAVGFGLGKSAAALERAGSAPLAIAYRPFISRWQGEESLELELRDLATPALG